MTHYQVVEAIPCHALAMAPRMRRADVAELALLGKAPLPALLQSIERSQVSLTALADGQPFAIFGHTPQTHLSSQAIVWMLSSRDLPKHARVFLPNSQGYVDKLLEEFQVLCNFVDERNLVAIHWLKWLGFTVAEEGITMGSGRLRYFERRR